MRYVHSRLVITIGLLGVCGVFWRAVADEKAGKKESADRIKSLTKTDTLGGQDRFLTFVSTDKPIYRGGANLYVRGVILRHDTRKPRESQNQLNALVEIFGPKGDTVASGWVNSQDSVLGTSSTCRGAGNKPQGNSWLMDPPGVSIPVVSVPGFWACWRPGRFRE